MSIGDISRLLAEGCLLALIIALVRTGATAAGLTGGPGDGEAPGTGSGLSPAEVGIFLAVCVGMIFLLARTHKRSFAEYRSARHSTVNRHGRSLPTDLEWIVVACVLLGVSFSIFVHPWVAALLGTSLLALSLVMRYKGA